MDKTPAVRARIKPQPKNRIREMREFLTEEQNLADLNSQVAECDKIDFRRMKASRIEGAFTGRVFIVYRAAGLTRGGLHKPPDVIGTVKVLGFACDDLAGAGTALMDISTGERVTVGHTPCKLFDYDAFIRIPPVFRLRWDARKSGSTLARTIVFPVELYSLNTSRHYSYGVTYVETPNRCKELYPGANLTFKF